MDQTKSRGPPTPEDLWGDCKIAGWTVQHTKLWRWYLESIAILIIFADQIVIDRITEKVLDTIQKAKSGDISAHEAICEISPIVIMSKKERDDLMEAIKKNGKMIFEYYFGNKTNPISIIMH